MQQTRVMTFEGTEEVELFSFQSDGSPVVGDRIVYAGESFNVIERTWYVDLDGTVSLRLWTERA